MEKPHGGREQKIKRQKFLIHWKGYHCDEATWEYEEDLSHAEAALQQYKDRKGLS